MALSNQQFYDRAKYALQNRIEWEKKLARAQLQRFCQDRGKQNNQPWARASNVRYPLSDMVIDQKKPFFFKLVFGSEVIPHFKALVHKNIPFCSKAAHYFDFLIKEKTDFEDEIQFSTDAFLQDGETYMKVTWDDKDEVPKIQEVQSLFIITPSGTTQLKNAEWIIHVIQYSKADFVRTFKAKGLDESKLKDLARRAGSQRDLSNDQLAREDDEYYREGINITPKEGSIITWECHYKDEDGNKRMRTISPDDTSFDFNDDHAYPYDHNRWMFIHHRRELVNKKLHSSRGIPELVQEGEHSLSAMWRHKQNAMTLFNAPVYTAPNGIPGSTGNIGIRPGSIIPFNVQLLRQGEPPISWDHEMTNTRMIWERRVSTPDFGVGKAQEGKERRTAKEIGFIQNLTSLGIELESGNFKKFMREILQQAWALVVQYKPKSLIYYMDQELSELPPESLNNDYIIHLSGSAESINKEWMMQKAAQLEQISRGNPYANYGEVFKNMLEVSFPGQVQRFFTDPQQRQQEAAEKAASDIDIMISVQFPIQPKPNDDHFTAAMIALKFLQGRQMTKKPLDPQASALIGRYIAGHREMLKKTNKQQFQQLTQALNAFDMMNKAGQRVGVNGAPPQGMPPPQAGVPQAPNLPVDNRGIPSQIPAVR